ncbi:hypothetical protein [Actinomadura parmotrematis]|uniref:Uncharacterized protein n=1 Tax=Actinomadura parmotrematis TaxID=2864039 RepID=A0ABS7FP36_9ACTN|nr:hypothetical protein [Actinomadura parmotrematis]MBW8481755.1 hypothetical protein [Actinomadura parmotrematis]
MAHAGAKPYTWAGVLAGLLLAVAALVHPAPAAAERRSLSGHTVIVGVPALMWSDVSPERTPALWKLAGAGGTAGLSVRATRPGTCPTDGWLTLSAGQRARLEPGDCVLPAAPETQGVTRTGTIAPGWTQIVADNERTSYHAQVGLLGTAVHGAGGCTFAVGAGAVYGVADGAGRVDRYAPSTDRVAPADWTTCSLSAVEVDDLFRAYQAAGVDAAGQPNNVAAGVRAKAVAAADRRVGQVLAQLPKDATVLVAGLSDTGQQPHVRLAAASGKGFPAGFMSSGATRQRGLVTLTDLTATALDRLGLKQPKEAVGSVWESHRDGGSVAARVDTLRDEDTAAQAIRGVQGSFFWILALLQAAVYGVVWLLLRGRDAPGLRRRALGVARIAALAAASAPVASFLAGLVPWWSAPRPTPVLVAAVAAFSALITGLALAGPWRRSAVVPALAVTATTVLVLALDVMTGSRLQMNSLMGYNALVAGRFYGFGNQAFSLFAVAAVLTAAWLASYPLRAGRTRLAVVTVAAVGAFAVAVDGFPLWGADFGGVLAMVPVFAVLALMVAGRRVSVVKVAVFAAVAVALVLAISYVNARSANPTHLGKFWQDLASGDAFGVVARKFESMLGSLDFWPVTVLLAVGLVLLYRVLAVGRPWRPDLLVRAYDACATMRAALLCALTAGVLGTLVNDSGVIILTVAFTAAVPPAIAVVLRSLERSGGPAGTPARERPAQRSGSAG